MEYSIDESQGYIYNYALPVGESTLKCALIDLPYWWTPDYLQNGTVWMNFR